MLYYARGGPSVVLDSVGLRAGLEEALVKVPDARRVLLIPPDSTRRHTRAGEMTRYAWRHFGDHIAAVMPALGTHAPMTDDELGTMFGDLPRHLFRLHDWRNDVVTLGSVSADYVEEISEGVVRFEYPAQVNRAVVEGGFDLILSISQVVPHEVVGMAGHIKNVLVGTGGKESIDKSHFLGAAYGMERIMGRADTPVRRVLNRACELYLKDLPLVHVLTVLGPSEDGLAARGLYIGDDTECFLRAADLSLQVNVEMVERPLNKAVVYLSPEGYRSTWLGNKSIYRTRMAIARAGELVVLAPGVKRFGEDPEIDRLIRKYGYKGTSRIMDSVEQETDLTGNLCAAAHLIHGSSEGRFRITYCPGGLTRREVESVGYEYGDLADGMGRYDPLRRQDGFFRTPDGEEVFYISNPAVGLWAHPSRFGQVSANP